MTHPFDKTSTTDEVLSGVNLSGKRVLVTGVSAGLGVETARALAAHGALDHGLKVRTLTLPDTVQDHDKSDVQYAEAGLDAHGIARTALAALGGAQAAAVLIA